MPVSPADRPPRNHLPNHRLPRQTSSPTLALRVVLGLFAGVGLSASFPASGESTVTIRAVGSPLAEIARRLGGMERSLSVEKGLADCKAVVLLKDTPRADALARIAEVFGAVWESGHPAAPDRLELRRTRGAEEWIRRWKSRKRDAARIAQAVRASRTRAYLNEYIEIANRSPTQSEAPDRSPPAGISSVTLTRFLGTFSSADLDAVARAVAERSEFHAGGEFHAGMAPVQLAYSRLNPQQKQALLAYVNELGVREVLEQLPRLQIAVHVDGYVNLEFHIQGARPIRQRAMAFSVSPAEMERIYHGSLMYLLTRSPTPPEALLGAALKTETVKDSVTGEARHTARPDPIARMDGPDRPIRLPGPAPNGLLYQTFLEVVHREGVDVVSDYFTSSLRLSPGKEMPAEGPHSLAAVLASAARSYERVFRMRGTTLMSRSDWWPDRDEEEPQYPNPDPWIDAKRRQRGLNLVQLLEIARLTAPQQNALGAYDDRSINFRREIAFLRSQRPLVAILNSLSPEQLKSLESAPGLAVRELPPRIRERLFELLSQPDGPGGAERPPPERWLDGRLVQVGPSGGRLAGRMLVAHIPGVGPFWSAALP